LRRIHIAALERLSNLAHRLCEWSIWIGKRPLTAAVDIAERRVGSLCTGQIAGIESTDERGERLLATAAQLKAPAVRARTARLTGTGHLLKRYLHASELQLCRTTLSAQRPQKRFTPTAEPAHAANDRCGYHPESNFFTAALQRNYRKFCAYFLTDRHI